MIFRSIIFTVIFINNFVVLGQSFEGLENPLASSKSHTVFYEFESHLFVNEIDQWKSLRCKVYKEDSISFIKLTTLGYSEVFTIRDWEIRDSSRCNHWVSFYNEKNQYGSLDFCLTKSCSDDSNSSLDFHITNMKPQDTVKSQNRSWISMSGMIRKVFYPAVNLVDTIKRDIQQDFGILFSTEPYTLKTGRLVLYTKQSKRYADVHFPNGAIAITQIIDTRLDEDSTGVTFDLSSPFESGAYIHIKEGQLTYKFMSTWEGVLVEKDSVDYKFEDEIYFEFKLQFTGNIEGEGTVKTYKLGEKCIMQTSYPNGNISKNEVSAQVYYPKTGVWVLILESIEKTNSVIFNMDKFNYLMPSGDVITAEILHE